MEQEGRVVLTDPASGRFGLLVRDGGYLLAEQIDARPIAIGATLAGAMGTMGVETLTDTGTGIGHRVFVLAYDLSREAVEQALR